MEETETPDYVRIKVKPINISKQNLIFCTRTDTDIKMDGVIHYSGYCPNYLCSDLTKIFRTNMVFKAKVDRLEDGKINFNITENIRNFSNKLAESRNRLRRTVSVGYRQPCIFHYHKWNYMCMLSS